MRASIEVLTDGSELTEPALFLTIRRYNDLANKNNKNDKEVDTDCIYYEQHNNSEQSPDDDTDEGIIVARYNLTGIPSLTGRISADQSYKLLQGGAFKAIFISSLISSSSFDNDDTIDDNNDEIYNNNMRCASLGGLPSLFLSLIQSGYKVAQPSTISKQNTTNEDSDSASEVDNNISRSSSGYGDVSIIGPVGTGSTIDGILDTMFGNVRRRPSIRICEVPTEKGTWYEVYSDLYVKIWGQSIRQCASNNLSSERMSKYANKREEVNEEDESSVSSTSSSDEDSSDEVSEREEDGGDDNNIQSSTESYSIIYIIMLLPQKTKYGSGEGGSYTFAIIPRDPSQQQNALQILRNLPQEVVSTNKGSTLLDFILHLDPPISKGSDKEAGNILKEPSSKRQRTECTSDDKSLKRVPLHEIEVPSWINKVTKHHLITSPNHTSIDEGILIRAQQRSKLLHDSLPFAFPLSSNHSSVRQDHDQQQYTTLAYGLRSCTSVILKGWNKSDTTKQPFSFLSRVDSINNRCCKASSASTPNEEAKDSIMSVRADYENMAQSIKCSFYDGSCFCGKCSGASCNTDENEIDLDDSDSDGSQTSKKEVIKIPSNDAIDVSSPHILILGTACATPSPLRGSSAYGILLPTILDGGVSSLVLSAILECGEGTLTSLLRHLPSLHDISNEDTSTLTSLEIHLSHVNFIWISHAHLDHYGDLPIVVQAIINAKQKFNYINHQEPTKLLVIAPSKVLKYLNIMLNDTTTAKSSIRSLYMQLFVGVTHRELQYSPFARHLISLVTEYKLPRQSGQIQQEQKHHYHPFQALQSVEVEHCREAFGLVLTLNIPTKHTHNQIQSTDTSRFILCFSGDTRPSIQFAKKCQLYSSPQHIDLLLHESTFLHDTQGQAEAARKRHSTTTEALDIANHMNAQCCILTHFSQRYKHISVKDVGSLDSYPFSWGVAIDGMMIPLTKHALSSVNTLSKCVDNLILQSDT